MYNYINVVEPRSNLVYRMGRLDRGSNHGLTEYRRQVKVLFCVSYDGLLVAVSCPIPQHFPLQRMVFYMTLGDGNHFPLGDPSACLSYHII